MTFDVAVIGAPFLDLTFEGLSDLPRQGDEIVATALHVAPGGTGTQAAALARLRMRVVIVAPVGSDFASKALRQMLQEEGVVVSGADRGGANVTTLLCTPSGVAMATALGAAEPTHDEVVSIDARAVIASLGRLHLVGTSASVYAVTGGLELPRVDDAMLDRLAGTRAVIMNAAEATALMKTPDADTAARHLAGLGTTAIVTQGVEGAVAVKQDAATRAEAPGLDVKHATGAGDLFTAAYVWADLRGASLEDGLRWATLYASLSLRGPTAFHGALRLEQVLEVGVARGLTPP